MAETTILYIEDNGSILELVTQMMKRHNIKVVGESNSFKGLQLVSIINPDLILLDINLPGMSGFDVLAEIKADPQTQNIPVIALTANSMHGDEKACLDAGFDGYISKPVTRNELYNTVLRYLEGETS